MINLTVAILIGKDHVADFYQLQLPTEVKVLVANLTGVRLKNIKKNWTLIAPDSNCGFIDRSTGKVCDFAATRNWALSYVKTDWVLFLDADEKITQSSWTKIDQAINSSQAHGYYLPRQEFFAGQSLNYGETGGAQFLRLFQVSAGRWVGMVHEKVLLTGQVGQLDAVIDHHSHPSISQFINQVSYFATIEARRRTTHPALLLFQLLTYPVAKFLLNFLIKSAWRDGWRGLVYSYLMSLHSLCVRVYQWPNHNQPQPVSRQPKSSSILWLVGMILIAGVSLGQLGRLTSYLSYGFYIHDLGVLIGLTGLSLEWIRRHHHNWRLQLHNLLSPKIKLLGLWLILLIIWPALQTNSWLPLFYSGRIVAYGLVLWHIYQFWSSRSEHKTKLIMFLSVFTLIFGFYQYFFWPDMRFLAALSFDDHLYRLIGSWFDPAVTGTIMVLLALHWFHQSVRWAKSNSSFFITALILGLLMTIAVGLTFSRASYLALILGLTTSTLMLWRIRQSWRSVLVSLMIVLSLGLSVTLARKPTGEGVKLQRTSSITARISNDRALIQNLSYKEWLFGQGLFYQTGQSPASNQARLPNNLMVLLITNLGLLGSLILLNSVGPKLYQLAKDQPLAVGITISLSTAAMFNNVLLHPAIWITAVLVWPRKFKE